MNVLHFAYLFISGGHLGCLHSLAIMNNAVMNVVYEFLCGHVYSVLLSIYVGVELLGLK